LKAGATIFKPLKIQRFFAESPQLSQ